jgi:hypothetical protein
LEQWATTFVPFVETHRIAGKQALHDRCNGDVAGSKQEVEMVRYQRPCQAGRAGFGDNSGKPVDEILSVNIVT